MSNFIGAVSRFTRSYEIVGREAKPALIAAAVIIAFAAALLGGARHSEVYADSPPPPPARASQSSADASQALRRYALQLLHILSNPDANQWERYRRAMPHCADAPAYLDEISSDNGVNSFDRALIALKEDLCGGLERRLEEARTVGLLLKRPESIDGYTLIPGRDNNYIHLIDHLGRVAHFWRGEHRIPHAKLLDNGNILVGMVAKTRSIVQLDQDSNIVWQYTHSDSVHHDFLKMPNGNVLILVGGKKTREEAIAVGVNPDLLGAEGMNYDYLIEIRPIGSEGGEIVWEWSTWDYIAQDFDPDKPNYGDPSEHPELIDINFLGTPQNFYRDAWDWLHTNTIDYNPALDQIMLSPRQYNELWIIDRSVSAEDALTRIGGNAGMGNTPPRMNVLNDKPSNKADKSGALLYRWGNPRSYGHGTAADRRLFLPHHAQWIAPGLPGAGNILMFNNGWGRFDEGQGNYSSIEEIIPPLDGYVYRREPGAAYPPSEPVWTYTAEPPTDFYSIIMGCAQRLPNGNTLICDSTSGTIFQVTPSGKTVWKYLYPMDANTPLKQGGQPPYDQFDSDLLNSNSVYRAYWYAPDHPGLQPYDLTPGDTIELYE